MTSFDTGLKMDSVCNSGYGRKRVFFYGFGLTVGLQACFLAPEPTPGPLLFVGDAGTGGWALGLNFLQRWTVWVAARTGVFG